MTDSFKVLKKSYHIKNIYCSIDINNIEKYLKRIEKIKNTKKGKIEVILVPDTLVYNENQLKWAIFIGKNRCVDKSNISKNLFTEILMILSLTNQINKVSKEWFLKIGKNNCYLCVLSEGKISVDKIKKELEITEIKNRKADYKKIIDFYKIKDRKNIEEEIIEKMALSLF